MTTTRNVRRVVRLRALQLRELSIRLERQPWRVPSHKDAENIEAAAALLEKFATIAERRAP
jgi:hypothetical protein